MIRANRPTLITILSAYYVIWGLATAVWSLLTSVLGVVMVCFVPGLLAGGIWGLIQGVMSIILGFSLYSGKNWAQIVVTVLAILGIISAVLGGLYFGTIVSIVINVIVLLYVNSDEAKRFFATN
jgi:ABC-type anion transport system duplicated permease subunit